MTLQIKEFVCVELICTFTERSSNLKFKTKSNYYEEQKGNYYY